MPPKRKTPPKKSDLYITLRVGCQYHIAESKIKEEKQRVRFWYSPRHLKFRGLCPYCEAPVLVGVSKTSNLVDEPETVNSVEGHWVTWNGDFKRNITALEDFYAQLPWYPEKTPPVSKWNKFINWFK